MALDLRLHSPAGAEPVVYTWPLTSGHGSDKHDGALEIVETIRWVCDDLPEMKGALEKNILSDYDTHSYESMRALCDRFNRAIDSVVALVSPATWTDKFPEASGSRQSPVDIDTTLASSGGKTPPLVWNYSVNHPRSVVNPGYCWRVDENGYNSQLRGGPLGSDLYKLQQWHCHWGAVNGKGSEHTVDGRSFSGELHLVHWNMTKYNSFTEAAGQPDGLAVLGVFLMVGSKHSELDKVVKLLPYIMHKGDKVTFSEPLDPAHLLPRSPAYWTYPGSLTTPPCTESVTWILFKDPVEVSAEQLALMRKLRCGEASCGEEAMELLHNYRPTLPLGNRELRDYGIH